VLDAQEQAVGSIADYQGRIADSVGLPWIAEVTRWQARLFVNASGAYLSTARRLLVK
jgi:hypothetical protein